MFWRKANSSKSMRNMAFRAIFAAACLSAFVIYGWGIQIGTVLELTVLLIVVVIAMIVPAALFVGLIKLIQYGLKRFRGEDQ